MDATEPKPYKIRNANENDIPFISTTWIKTVWAEISRLDSPVRNLTISKDVFFEEFRSVVAILLSKNTVLIACDKDDENLLYGWACFNEKKGVVHYVFIKSPFRKFGIAKALIDIVLKSHEKIFYTHYTFPCGFLQGKQDKFVFNPYEVMK